MGSRVGKESNRLVLTAAIISLLLLSITPIGHAARTVTFWTQSKPAWLAEVLDQFTQETGIQVETRIISFGLDELYVAWAGDAFPDLFSHGEAAMGALAEQGLMAPLDEVVSDWDFLYDVIPGILENTTYKGQLVGLPFKGVSIENLVYHTRMFEEAGLDPRRPPERWDDLAAYARRLVRRDADDRVTRAGLTMPSSGTTLSFWFRLFTMQSGLDPFGDELKSITLLDDRIVDSLQFFADLFHVHRVTDVGFGGTFNNATTAMRYDRLRPFEDTLGTEAENIAVALFPYNTVPVTRFVGDFISLSPKAENREEAIELLKFLMHPDQHAIVAEGYTYLPIYRDGINWDYVRDSQVYMDAINLMVMYGKSSTPHKNFFELRSLQVDLMSAVLNPSNAPRIVLEQNENRFRQWVDN